jgi:tRNA A58 N-methylase Trm61
VCEIGAGEGALSIAAARVVGSQGHVYTSELGDSRVKALQAKVGAMRCFCATSITTSRTPPR